MVTVSHRENCEENVETMTISIYPLYDLYPAYNASLTPNIDHYLDILRRSQEPFKLAMFMHRKLCWKSQCSKEGLLREGMPKSRTASWVRKDIVNRRGFRLLPDVYLHVMGFGVEVKAIDACIQHTAVFHVICADRVKKQYVELFNLH